MLRQIPQAYGVPGNIAQVAYEAADKMDRFPVADVAVDATGALDGSGSSTAGSDTAPHTFTHHSHNTIHSPTH